MDEMTLTLNSPITEEQWDAITDVDFDRTDRIRFSTKHGKKVEFVKAPQWILCSERMPEEEVDVLVTLECGDLDIAQWEFNKWADEPGIEWWDGEYRVHPIAWMKLPEPYKEDDE